MNLLRIACNSAHAGVKRRQYDSLKDDAVRLLTSSDTGSVLGEYNVIAIDISFSVSQSKKPLTNGFQNTRDMLFLKSKQRPGNTSVVARIVSCNKKTPTSGN